ncbi:hypothetical protein BGZ95_006117 [Linnemannia exigua]|uniref:Eisosome component PIL1-domain-containing protein n=1 Tax=Linnemannia exigua TaxID=604196 RepID=A0AAD4H7F4_9FUNG|nr:hypothetical protein BGZ95_006117 [Linnemannia exigua]
MSHLIDPCLRATKIAHGIRRGIDGISPLSGLVPELRILIQEQKNVLTSLKRTAFEKEEAAKHLAIYAKTEGPDLSDTLSKLSLLIRKAADLERAYGDSLAQSRELFKEVRAAEDNNYSVRKRKLDLESKLATSGGGSSSSSTSAAIVNSGTSTALVKKAGGPTSPPGPELHPEMTLLRKETMTIENDLEDLKRKRIKRATTQQLDALEKLGKEMIVIAYYGREIMDQVDDTPTEAGQYADDRYGQYDGAAKTAYSLKACLDTLKDWPSNAPIVQMHEVDMGDFPKDTKGAMDAMLHDLAVKTGSDWYDLQQPSPTSSTTSSSYKQRPSQHTRNSSTSSTSSTIKSARDSMSSGVTTVTYVDGVPMVQVINEIPPTPENEDGPIVLDSASTAATTASTTTAQEPIPVFVASQLLPETTAAGVAEPIAGTTGATTPTTAPASPIITATNTSSPIPMPIPHPAVAVEQSPFIPHSTYTPSTTYQPGHDPIHTQGTPPTRPRPISGDRHARGGHTGGFHAPHPLMMQHQQQYPPAPSPSPPGQSHIPMSMPVPMHNVPPYPMQMPVPHIPGSPDPHYPYSNEFGAAGGGGGGGPTNKRHSNPISVSFPLHQQQQQQQQGGSPSPGNHHHHLPVVVSSSSSSTTSPAHSRSPSPRPQGPRGPQAILPPTEPGFRIPVGVEENECEENEGEVEGDGELTSASTPGGRRPMERQQRHPQAVVYDGPPPDYAEAAMNPPAEKFDDKKRR